MKFGRIAGIIVLFIALFSSCQKEFFQPDFRIGNREGLTIQPIENKYTEACYGHEKVIEWDVDNNGEPDLKFYTYAVDSMGDQDKRGSSVWSLDGDVEFGYRISKEQLYSVSKNSNKVKREIIYNERSHFYCPNCQNLGMKSDRFTFSSPVLLKYGNYLSNDIKWSDKLQILSQLDQSRQFSKEKDNVLVYNNILSGIWDDNDEGYLPFRIKLSLGKYKYGWIKLRVVDHRRIEFFEIALQDDFQ